MSFRNLGSLRLQCVPERPFSPPLKFSRYSLQTRSMNSGKTFFSAVKFSRYLLTSIRFVSRIRIRSIFIEMYRLKVRSIRKVFYPFRCFHASTDVNSNFFTSKRPRSVSFRSGMTIKDMKQSVMIGSTSRLT